MAEDIDATMQGLKSTRFDSSPNRPHTQAASNQLSTGDDIVLTIRKGC